MRKAVLSRDYQFPAGKYNEYKMSPTSISGGGKLLTGGELISPASLKGQEEVLPTAKLEQWPYKKYSLFRCYGAEKFEDFCKAHLAGEIDMEGIWNDFFRNHVSNGKTDFVLEAAYTKDHNSHVLSFSITYVFPNVLCMDRGDCESVVIEM